jgi:hypothetical protein
MDFDTWRMNFDTWREKAKERKKVILVSGGVMILGSLLSAVAGGTPLLHSFFFWLGTVQCGLGLWLRRLDGAPPMTRNVKIAVGACAFAFGALVLASSGEATALPTCGSAEAQDAVKAVVTASPDGVRLGLRVVDISDVRTVKEWQKEAAQGAKGPVIRRACGAALATTGGTYGWSTYTLRWAGTDSNGTGDGKFLVELRLGG